LAPAETAAGRWLDVARHAASRLARRDVGELLSISAEALSRYKLRTALSVLGVILGVAAVIAMMSVSEGAHQEALRQVELLGLDNLVVRNRVPSGAKAGAVSHGLVTGDVEGLRALVPLVAALTPLVERYPTVSGPARSLMARVLGVTEEYRVVLGLDVSRGRLLAPLDVTSRARVCVLGAGLARALFGYRDALSASVRIDSEWYEVVGLLAERGSDARGIGALAARDLNQAMLVPVSTLLGQSPALDPERRVDEIWIQVKEGKRVQDVGQVVQHTLASLHRRADDVEVVVPRELLNQRYRTQRTFGVVVGSVAVLSLLVGGIGIMNIMLASVLERTREIGIRRTVGATRRDIVLQFLAESLLMTLAGGVAGIAVGVGVSWAITAYAGWSTRVSSSAVALAVIVSLLVGLTFGIYPATMAARLEPIDALRYE
jgi:putative ABC transport system permease protein